MRRLGEWQGLKLDLAGPGRIPQLLTRIGLLPSEDEREAAVRRALTYQVLCQHPSGAILSIIIASGLVLSLANEVPPGALAAWLLSIIVFNLLRRMRARRLIGDEAQLSRAVRKPWLTVLMATTSAVLFMVPSVFWFDAVGFQGKVTICIMITGLMSGGCLSLAPMPVAAFAYLVPLSIGVMLNYHTMGLSALVGMMLLYTAGLLRTVIGGWKRLDAFLRLEIELAETSQLVELLRACVRRDRQQLGVGARRQAQGDDDVERDGTLARLRRPIDHRPFRK